MISIPSIHKMDKLHKVLYKIYNKPDFKEAHKDGSLCNFASSLGNDPNLSLINFTVADCKMRDG